jgi:hypothetical protein
MNRSLDYASLRSGRREVGSNAIVLGALDHLVDAPTPSFGKGLAVAGTPSGADYGDTSPGDGGGGYFAAAGKAGSLSTSRASCCMMTVALDAATSFLTRSSDASVWARSVLIAGTPLVS